MPYFYSTCVPSSHLNWKEIWSIITKATFLSEECKPQVQQEERTSVYCKKAPLEDYLLFARWKKNMHKCGRAGAVWWRLAAEQNSPARYEGLLRGRSVFGKYWCFSSGRNKFELRGNRCSPVRFTLCRNLSMPVHNCLLQRSKTTGWWVWDLLYQLWQQRQRQCQRFPQMTTNIFICMLPTDANASCRFK